MKFALRIVLWLGAIALTIFGLLLMAGALDSSGSDAAGRGLSQAYGMFIALLLRSSFPFAAQLSLQ